ncbi:MAG: LacI family DNA-binding transcriptional regulator [Capsulimonadaceae bacterium]|nr:LacI family DNA-binding transcriptional regulator [Capsulimonadaceae bacterium]
MQAPYKKSTVTDVAARAGVSQSAVSHYINGRVNVCSAETAERIKQAIEELHFAPSRALRYQGRQATNTIGVSVSLPSEDETDSPYSYLHRFWSGVSKVVDQQSYRIMHFPRSMRNSESCNPFLDGSIDGLLISASSSIKRFEVLADAGLPTVCVSRSADLPASCGCVVAREEDTAELAMTHLRELGHRRIAYLGSEPGLAQPGGQPISPTGDPAMRRYNGWRSWAEKCGGEIDDLAMFVKTRCYPSPEEMIVLAKRLIHIPDAPTAVLCYNDRLAMLLMQAFKQCGLTLPEEMSVVGVDNEGACGLFNPPLTSVEVPVTEIGQRATEMLIGMLRGTGSAQHVEIPVTQLVVRSSTCPPRKGTPAEGQ